jgi:hypothetical protein
MTFVVPDNSLPWLMSRRLSIGGSHWPCGYPSFAPSGLLLAERFACGYEPVFAVATAAIAWVAVLGRRARRP